MFARLAVAIAVGFVGAYPLAVSSGLMSMLHDVEKSSLVIVSGLILAFLTLSLIGPTIRLIRQILEILRRVEERPNSLFAGTMLLLGVACAISSLMIATNMVNRPPTSLSMNLPGFNAGTQVVSQPPDSIVLGLLTILTFLLGASLVGLGIWSSIRPSKTSAGLIMKPVVREFEEVAT